MSNASHSYLLVLRGQPFRGNVTNATPQLLAYESMLVQPLRRRGHTVDVAVAASEDRWLKTPDVARRFRKEAEDVFGAQALAQLVVAPTNNQADGMRLAMQTLRAVTMARRTYDAYVVSRLDLLLHVDVTRWNCSLTERVNFVSKCGMNARFDGCVNDVLITLPRADVNAFARAVGRPAVAGCDCIVESQRKYGCPRAVSGGCFDDWNIPQTHGLRRRDGSTNTTSALDTCHAGAKRYAGHGCGARIASFLSKSASFCMDDPALAVSQNDHQGYTLLRENAARSSNEVP
jgi:hypothetical protein